MCKDAEERIISSVLNQLGVRVQSIVTETDLINWYEKALRGVYADELGEELISCLCGEIVSEFPSLDEFPDVLKKRGYEGIRDGFWRT